MQSIYHPKHTNPNHMLFLLYPTPPLGTWRGMFGFSDGSRRFQTTARPL